MEENKKYIHVCSGDVNFRLPDFAVELEQRREEDRKWHEIYNLKLSLKKRRMVNWS